MAQFAQLPAIGGFYKASDHATDVAILIEPIRFERDRPSQYGPKDSIHADMTFFDSAGNLEAGIGDFHGGMIIQGAGLVPHLEGLVGQAVVVKQGRGKPKAGQNAPWIWERVAPKVQAKVGAYVDKRDAERAAAADAMPDFLK